MATRHALRLVPSLSRARSRTLAHLPAPLVIVGVWAAVAAAATLQAVALARLNGRADLGDVIASRLSILPLWALATPLILRSTRWLPVVGSDRRPNPVAIAAHLVFGSLFIIAANVVIREPIALEPAPGGGLDGLVRSTQHGLAEFFPAAMVVYGVIVAVGHLLARTATRIVAPTSNAPASIAPNSVAPESVAPASAEAPAPTETEVLPAAAALAGTDAHITVRQWNRVHVVRVADIDWVEAQDNYVVVHAAERSYKGRERISDVEVQLDPGRFVRIHRSTIVQIGKIREVQPLTHGDHAVILRDGTVLRVARSRRQALGTALGIDL